jgi:hypothetical protein
MGKVSRRIATGSVVLLALAGIGAGGAAVGSNSVGSSRTSGSEHITIIQTSLAGGPVFFRGLVNDVGVDNESADGTTSTLVLGGGTIVAAHASTEDGGNFVPDPVSCLARFTDAGTFNVTSGTGAYAGISGEGTYTARGTLFFPRTSDGCNFEADPIAVNIIVRPVGTLRLGVAG